MIPYDETPLFFRLLWEIMPYSLDRCDRRHVTEAINEELEAIKRGLKSDAKYISTCCCYTVSRFFKLINPHMNYEDSLNLLEQIKTDDINAPFGSIVNSPLDLLIIVSFDYKEGTHGHTFCYVLKNRVTYQVESSLNDFKQRITIVSSDDVVNRLAAIKLETNNYRFQIIQLPSDEILQQNHDFIISKFDETFSVLLPSLIKCISKPPE